MAMIVKNNVLKVPSFRKTKVTLGNFSSGVNSANDESVKNISDAKLVCNFDINDGALKPGAGLKEFLINGKTLSLDFEDILPKKFFYFKNFDVETGSQKDVLLCYSSIGLIYVCNLYEDEPKFNQTGICFTSFPTAVTYNNNGKNVMLLSSQSDPLCVFDGENFKFVEGAPKFNSMCVHNERVFATEDKKSTSLWFSDDFNPLNWYISIDEAGFIDFPDERGPLLKVISFLDYVYIFREYGITRLTAYGRQEDFSVSNLHSKVGKIYGESVTDCGNYVYFLSDNGIYKFNGVDAVKVLNCYDNFLNGVDNSDANGIYYNDKFWLNLKMNLITIICYRLLMLNFINQENIKEKN